MSALPPASGHSCAFMSTRPSLGPRPGVAAVTYRSSVSPACEASSPLFLCHRNRHAGNLHADRKQLVPRGEVKRLPVIAAERDVGGGGLAVDDAAELLAQRIENV